MRQFKSNPFVANQVYCQPRAGLSGPLGSQHCMASAFAIVRYTAHSPLFAAFLTASCLLHGQATHNHLASLAANVPLPASPLNDAKEGPPAVVALAAAVVKPSHIPAPLAKPSRLKKPTNTSGFFSSGRSFTSAGSGLRYVPVRPARQVCLNRTSAGAMSSLISLSHQKCITGDLASYTHSYVDNKRFTHC